MGRIHHAAMLIAGLAISTSALGAAREACTRARLVGETVLQVRRCIQRDTLRDISPRVMGAWTGEVPITLEPMPPNFMRVFGTANFAVTPGPTKFEGSMEWAASSQVMDAPPFGPTRVEIDFSYDESFATTKSHTYHFSPHHIIPGRYMVASLESDIGTVLSEQIVDSASSEAKFSIATPGNYRIKVHFYWTSEEIHPGNSMLTTPAIGFDAKLTDGASCPADLTSDQQVDDTDFVGFALAYNILDCTDPAMTNGCPADINADGVVDDSDFVLFAAAYDQLVCD